MPEEKKEIDLDDDPIERAFKERIKAGGIDFVVPKDNSTKLTPNQTNSMYPIRK